MHCITIAMRDTNAPVWTLLYKTQESCNIAWKLLHGDSDSYYVSDDFGQEASIPHACKGPLLREDLDQSMLAHIERGLHNARTQAKANQIGANDPILKTARMTAGGPAIHSPFGNGSGMGHG